MGNGGVDPTWPKKPDEVTDIFRDTRDEMMPQEETWAGSFYSLLWAKNQLPSLCSSISTQLHVSTALSRASHSSKSPLVKIQVPQSFFMEDPISLTFKTLVYNISIQQ